MMASNDEEQGIKVKELSNSNSFNDEKDDDKKLSAFKIPTKLSVVVQEKNNIVDNHEDAAILSMLSNVVDLNEVDVGNVDNSAGIASGDRAYVNDILKSTDNDSKYKTERQHVDDEKRGMNVSTFATKSCNSDDNDDNVVNKKISNPKHEDCNHMNSNNTGNSRDIGPAATVSKEVVRINSSTRVGAFRQYPGGRRRGDSSDSNSSVSNNGSTLFNSSSFLPGSGVTAGGVTNTNTDVDVPEAEVKTTIVNAYLVDEDLREGYWRNNLCDCFDICCRCVWWIGLCCRCILAGQVMQRLKLNWYGKPGPFKNTCRITVFIMTTGWVLFFTLFLSFASTDYFVGWPVLLAILTYIIIISAYTRRYMRRKYKIRPSCCGDNCLDDCCVIYWCGCCAMIQMHRHTHDEKLYRYNVMSQTGLDHNSPEIV